MEKDNLAARRKAALGAIWNEVVHFVEQEIRYYEDAHLLPEGQICAEEIVDAVADDVLQKMPDLSPAQCRHWIWQTTMYKLRAALGTAWVKTPDRMSLNTIVPATETASATDEAEMEFVQPDNADTWADILPDPRAMSPDNILASWEIAEPLAKALAALAPQVRETFALYSIDSKTSAEIAALQKRDITAVREDITRAQNILRRLLRRE